MLAGRHGSRAVGVGVIVAVAIEGAAAGDFPAAGCSQSTIDCATKRSAPRPFASMPALPLLEATQWNSANSTNCGAPAVPAGGAKAVTTKIAGRDTLGRGSIDNRWMQAARVVHKDTVSAIVVRFDVIEDGLHNDPGARREDGNPVTAIIGHQRVRHEESGCVTFGTK